MRVIEVPRHGGSDVLTVADRADPDPGPGEVAVVSFAAGVNFIDVYQRSGVYPTDPPFVLGQEGAGRVRAVGEGVTGVAVGDRVAWTGVMGSYAEQVLVPADRAVPVPDAVDDETAAALPLQGMTAHYLATDTYPVQPGDTVLVHAAAGGVGLLLTQIVRLRGGRVIGTAGSEEKAELARAAGAEAVIRYREQDVAEEVRRITGGEGVAAAYDGVGRATFDASLASLRPRGMLVLFGGASGQVPPFDLQRLNAGGSLFVTRPSLVHYVARREELLARAGEVFGWVADGRLDVRIGGRYPLADVRAAHDALEGRRTTGKLLLLPG